MRHRFRPSPPSTLAPTCRTHRWTSRSLATGIGVAVVVLVLGACGSERAPGGFGGTGSGSGATASSPTLRVVTGQRTMADGALACPASITESMGMTVPEQPQGVDGATSLLPGRVPTTMAVCSYPVLDVTATAPLKAPFLLARRVVATERQRADVLAALQWSPRDLGVDQPCNAMAGDETAYLVGTVFDGAVVWVAAKADPNTCSLATNGDFVARAGVGALLDATFGGAHSEPSSPASRAGCSTRSWGRLGDEVSLAPPGDPGVTVCRDGLPGAAAVPLDARQSDEVVTLLRSLRTRASDGTGSCDPDPDGVLRVRGFTLVLRYEPGPAVRVYVDPWCRPGVRSGGLAADDAGAVTTLVEQWSKPGAAVDPNGSVSSDGSVSSHGTTGGATTGGGTPGQPGSIEPALPSAVPGLAPAPQTP